MYVIKNYTTVLVYIIYMYIHVYIHICILYIYIALNRFSERNVEGAVSKNDATPVRFPEGACWELQNDDLYNVFRTSLFFGLNSFRRQTSILVYT